MVITLNPLLKVSAGQWNTLVNFASALCGLADQICIGTNIRTVYTKIQTRPFDFGRSGFISIEPVQA
ncbi:hypothetical protein [Comamonas sp.]|uniref:hypothetical protein n=1 Tax=Comamonas sp. TaxID=34028 RepID=UPI0028A2C2E8|nr:hypothetical protein [Comamonas sp.]